MERIEEREVIQLMLKYQQQVHDTCWFIFWKQCSGLIPVDVRLSGRQRVNTTRNSSPCHYSLIDSNLDKSSSIERSSDEIVEHIDVQVSDTVNCHSCLFEI